jgi:hypothetical protein
MTYYMCRYQDPDYPEWFTGYFPRILLPHRNLGADYEIVRVRDIIGPASISDDLSLMHYDPADEAAARQKHLKQPRSRKASVQRKKMMQELPDLNWPLIPTKFHCPHKKCTRRGCTLLHSDQYAGGHIDETHLKVVNLLVLEFSRGVWKPCWSQVSSASLLSLHCFLPASLPPSIQPYHSIYYILYDLWIAVSVFLPVPDFSTPTPLPPPPSLPM